MKMVHPDIEAPAEVLNESVFNMVWAPRDWKLLDEPSEYAGDQLGRLVRDAAADLTTDDLRALVARRGGEYPAANAKKSSVLKSYLDSFRVPARAAEPEPSANTDNAGDGENKE
jgi:hypothetical protein